MDLNFGVVGYGAWGAQHANTISKTPGARLVSIGTPSADSQERARKAFPSVEIYSNYHEMFQKKDLDVAVIVVPTYLHEDVSTAALKAGKHVLLEKPMALDAAGCDRILAAAKKSGKVLNVAQEFRFSIQWGAIKKYVEEGRLGNPIYLLINLWRRPYRYGRGGWRRDITKVGSWIMEEPIHFFDLALWYFQVLGDPVSVFAHANGRGLAEGFYDNFTAVLRWSNGSYAVISQTLGGFEHHKLVELVGMKGAVRAWWSGAMDRADQASFGMKMIEGLKGGEVFDECEATEVPLEGKSGEIYELQELIRNVIPSIRGG
ncbi:MAG: Gfo/Idh/MocA family oxidoreductase, partial [Deltaproteobacteria bacterium]|nr:Gfo/Idh/MocA family oxidoreductase [Deltaproteobacteria bacterium]